MAKLQKTIENIKKEKDQLGLEIREKLLSYIVAAFGLVAGLAWNDAIKALIEYLFPLQQNTLLAKFLYALIISLVVVIATVYITRMLKKEEEQE